MRENKNWQKYCLEEITQIIAGQSPKSDSYNFNKDGLPFYQGKTDFGYIFPSPKVWCSSPIKIAKKNDILLSVRAPVGPTNIANEKCCIGRGLCAIRANKDVDHKFLYYYFNFFENYIWENASGSIFQAITIDDIKNLEISVPTYDEQKRIVKIIETKLTAVEKAKRANAEQLSIIERLFDSYVQKMVFNNEWKKYKLGDICTFTGGSQPPKSTFAYQPKKGYIRLVQIQDFRKNNVAVYIPKETAKRVFLKDDIMIGRYGPPVFQILRGLEGAYNVALMKAETKDNAILDNNFLFYLLKERNIQNAVINQSQRSAGQSGVDKIFLERQFVRIPDIKIQNIIFNKIEKFKERSFILQNYLNEQSTYINALSQSVLRKAFNGEY
jgi:type I restriction enzyme S subunit